MVLAVLAILLQTLPVLPGQVLPPPPPEPATGPTGGMVPEGRAADTNGAAYAPLPARPPSYGGFGPPAGVAVSNGTTRPVSYLVLRYSYQPDAAGSFHSLPAGGSEMVWCGDASGCFVRFLLVGGVQNVRTVPGHRYRFQVDRLGRYDLFDLG